MTVALVQGFDKYYELTIIIVSTYYQSSPEDIIQPRGFMDKEKNEKESYVAN